MNNPAFMHTQGAPEPDHGGHPLTARERDIQRLITTGMSNKLIARELGISDGTVKIHVKNLMRKLGARSRLQVALLALGVSIHTQAARGPQ